MENQDQENRGGRPLAPIFKRKPRQALLAHPNNITSDNLSQPSAYAARTRPAQAPSYVPQSWQNQQVSQDFQQQNQWNMQQNYTFPQQTLKRDVMGNQRNFNQQATVTAPRSMQVSSEQTNGGLPVASTPSYGQPAPGPNYQNQANSRSYGQTPLQPQPYRQNTPGFNTAAPNYGQQNANSGFASRNLATRQAPNTSFATNKQQSFQQQPKPVKQGQVAAGIRSNNIGGGNGVYKQQPCSNAYSQQQPDGSYNHRSMQCTQLIYNTGQAKVPAVRYNQGGTSVPGQSFVHQPSMYGDEAPSCVGWLGGGDREGFSKAIPTPQSSTTQVPDRPPKKAVMMKKNVDKETSQRLLTSTIQGMKHWAQYKTKLMLMFEVIGMVNSAVSINPGETKVSFLMKDDKGQIQTVFHEIDRQLPRVVRGQWYRCVGTLNTNQDLFKCVSIRSASEDEKKLHKVFVNSSDRAMRGWVAGAREI